MKKILLLFVGSFLLQAFSYAQQGWVTQTTNTTTNIYNVCFVDRFHGWAVGETGLVIHTDDGGHNWIMQNSGLTNQINDVYFVDTMHGWACGNAGKIIHTSDGGATWTLQTTSNNTLQNLNTIQFQDNLLGWVAGANNTIFVTTDGGLNWIAKTAPNAPTVNAMKFISPAEGWITGASGKLAHTTDSGMTWTTQTTGIATTIYAIDFVDTLHGWLAGTGGVIRKTTNGGQSWTAQSSGVTDMIMSIEFLDTLYGWAVGASGLMLNTSDGGQSWTKITNTITTNLRCVTFNGENKGWIAGNTGTMLAYTTPQEICMVTVDTLLQLNKIIWEKIFGIGTAYYKIYKLQGLNYTLIGTIPFNDMSEFVDPTSNPAQVSARYKISYVDSMGFESEKSPFHQTMWLGISVGGLPSTMVLDWDDYIDEAGHFTFAYYYIYRGVDPLTMTLHDSVTYTFTGYNDINVFDEYYYQVVVGKLVPCIPTMESKTSTGGGPYVKTVSNIEVNRLTGFKPDALNNKIAIYPNPAQEQIQIHFSNPFSKPYQLTVYSLTGNIVFNTNDFRGEKFNVDCSAWAKGFYTVEVRGEKVFRGKVVVE